MEPPSFAFLIEKPFDGEDGLEPPAFRYESRSTQGGPERRSLVYLYWKKVPLHFLQENDFAQTVDRPAAM